MSEALWYVVGLLTLPTIAIVPVCLAWCLDRTRGVECDHCGKVLGRPGVDYRLGTELRWKAHYLRYWYRTRHIWTCH